MAICEEGVAARAGWNGCGAMELVDYLIRPCGRHDELAACVRLQKDIWGYAEEEVYPLRLFINLTKIGGHVLGAFTPDGQAVGFVASMPAWHGRRRYYHSLSLGVLPGHEDRGLGRALKLEQRKLALQAGIKLIEWTFDPLKVKNAYFNIVRLGAICRRYSADHYGPFQNRFERGLPTDRLIAEWRLESPRVRRALAGKPPRTPTKAPATIVGFPQEILRLEEEQPQQARAIQAGVREQLIGSFARGLAISGFERDDREARYLLDPYRN